MERILVTGGAGFAGSTYVRSMLAGEYPGFEDTLVTVVDDLSYGGNRGNLPETHPRLEFVKADIGNLDLMTLLLRGQEAVVHLASESHTTAQFVHTNAFGTSCVLEACVRAQVPRVVHVSTDDVYGSIEHGSWTEDSPLKPSSPFGASKAGGDLMVQAYSTTHGLDVTTIRSCHVFGPYQHRDKLIPRFITRLLKGRTVGLYGDGSTERDWLHVEDQCHAIQLLLANGRAGEIYHVAGGNPHTDKQIVERLADLCGASDEQIEYAADHVAAAGAHDLRHSLDDSKIRDELGYRPSIPFEDGLASTVDWYKANYLGHIAYY